MTAPVSPAVRWTTVAAVLLVAAVAAVVSYAHMQHVALRSGEAWRSYLLPLSVDGLMVAASMVLLTRRRAGLPGGALAWTALLGGVGASLAANVAAADPTATARLVAAWPALAFAVAFELLLEQRRPAEPDPGPEAVAVASTPTTAPEPAPPVREHAPDPVPIATPLTGPAPAPAPAPARRGNPAPAPVGRAGDPDDLAARARQLADRNGGHPPGRRALARELGVTEHRARTVLDALGTPVSNGATGGDRR